MSRVLFVLALMLTAVASRSGAQPPDAIQFIRGLYPAYLGREARSDEVAYWLREMRAGRTPLDVQINVAASEECFNRFNRDNGRWIEGVLSVVLQRHPSRTEYSQAVSGFNRRGGNRVAWASDLFQSLAGGGGQPGGFLPIDQLPRRLVTAAEMVQQSVHRELPGLQYGIVRLQANTFLSAARNGFDAFNNPLANPTLAWRHYQAVSSALQALQVSVGNVPFATRETRLYLAQAAELLENIRLRLPNTDRPPIILFPPIDLVPPPIVPPPPIGLGGIDQQFYDQFVGNLAMVSRNSQQLVLLLRSNRIRDPFQERLLRDVESFADRVDALRLKFRVGYPLEDLRRNIRQIGRQVDDISRQIRLANRDVRITQNWYDILVALNKLADLANVARFDVINVGQAVPINPPTFNQFPWQIEGIEIGAGFGNELVDLAEQMLNECDAILHSFPEVTFDNHLVPKYLNEVSALKNLLGEFRDAAWSNVPRRNLRQRSEELKKQLQQVHARWDQVARFPQYRNMPGLSNLDQPFLKIEENLRYP